MSRVPKIKSRLSKAQAAVFMASPGTRRLAAGLSGVLAVLFLIHQTQIEDVAPGLRAFSLAMTAIFGAIFWFFWNRGSRKGPVLRLTKEGFGIAVGFRGWLEFPWDQVKAFRYWEPTGIAMMVKRRQSRWIGVLLNEPLPAAGLTWDERFEIWLNKVHNRPGLCVLHPFVDAPILDVLQAFKDYAPRALDDYTWMTR